MDKHSDHPYFVGSWNEIIQLGSELPSGTFLTIHHWNLGNPADAGLYWLPGYPKGTLKQWRYRLPDDSGVHVYIYDDRLVIHRDRVDPSASLAGHLIADCPGLVAAAALVSVVGLVAAASTED